MQACLCLCYFSCRVRKCLLLCVKVRSRVGYRFLFGFQVKARIDKSLCLFFRERLRVLILLPGLFRSGSCLIRLVLCGYRRIFLLRKRQTLVVQCLLCVRDRLVKLFQMFVCIGFCLLRVFNILLSGKLRILRVLEIRLRGFYRVRFFRRCLLCVRKIPLCLINRILGLI